MRLIVTGVQGQVVISLLERARQNPDDDLEVVALGRPDLDLADADSIARAFAGRKADAIVNAAAYTAVDKAEIDEELATRINGTGAGAVAAAARQIGVPILHLSTDYVFDGSLDRPYREDDPPAPIGAYGRSKLAGELAVAAAHSDHVILRTAWVYSPFGANFVKTMLRLGETRRSLNVVADQRGCPTSALDIADAVIAVARNLTATPMRRDAFGIFNMTGSGEASWAEFAAEVFALASRHGREAVEVMPIATSQYPTPARRPANSRLDGSRLTAIHGVTLPLWRDSLRPVVARLIQAT